MARTIYPSIPDPGNGLDTIVPTLLAMKQTLQMIIINAQSTNPNFTPSSAAQVFVTNARLNKLGVKGAVVASPTVASLPEGMTVMRAEIANLKTRVAQLETQLKRTIG